MTNETHKKRKEEADEETWVRRDLAMGLNPEVAPTLRVIAKLDARITELEDQLATAQLGLDSHAKRVADDAGTIVRLQRDRDSVGNELVRTRYDVLLWCNMHPHLDDLEKLRAAAASNLTVAAPLELCYPFGVKTCTCSQCKCRESKLEDLAHLDYEEGQR